MKEKFLKYHLQSSQIWNKQRDIQLVSLLEHFVNIDTRGGNFLDIYQFHEILENLKEEILIKYPLLKEISKEELFYRACLIITINEPSESFVLYSSFQNLNNKNTIANYLIKYKHLYLFYNKKEQLRTLIEKYEYLSNEDIIPNVTIQRYNNSNNNNVSSIHSSNLNHLNAETSIFQQVYKQLARVPFASSHKQMFQVNFIGEDGIDEGGLFRDALTQMTNDIQELLFIPTPNSQNEHCSRILYVPNPNRCSENDFRMFEFTGRLIGSALLSCTVCSGISWPLMIWKYLLGLKIEDSDYKSIDTLYYESIEMLTTMPQPKFNDEFSDIISLDFTIRTLDGKEVDLISSAPRDDDDADPDLDDDDKLIVNWDNRLEYVSLARNYRKNEIYLQLEALKRGFIQGTQEHSFLFSWFTPIEIQILIEGNQTIDLNILKLHTNYSNCNSDSPIVTFFWNIMDSFDEDQRRAFLKFTSGSPVLPTLWNQRQFTIFVTQKTPSNYLHLPSAHTCSWRLDIPNYATEELFREKLLLSLAHADSFTFA